jgi:hypothetical protein
MQFIVSRHPSWVLPPVGTAWAHEVKFDSDRIPLHKVGSDGEDEVRRGWTIITQPGGGLGEERQAGVLTSRDEPFLAVPPCPSPFA